MCCGVGSHGNETILSNLSRDAERIFAFMKPIFEPGDFETISDENDTYHIPVATAQWVNAKLQSLGIDAETPEKFFRLNEEVNWLKKRLAELERQLEENQTVYAEKLSQIYQCLREERIQNKMLREEEAKLKRMIADLP